MDNSSLTAFNRIQDVLARHQEILSGSKPVIGWFCSYTPVEILRAAGLSSYRILPDPGRAMTRADSYIDRNFCPYVRSCLGEALDGKYGFLDGLIVVNSCDAMRRLYDAWRYNIGGDFVYLLDLPRVNSGAAAAYYRDCLQRLSTALESRFKTIFSPAALAGAISATNNIRSLVREFYLVNRDKGMPLSAAQVQAVVKAGAVLPDDMISSLLQQLVDELNHVKARLIENPRILITGSILENPQILQLIEECGAEVISDDTCTGTRRFWNTVQTGSDFLMDLSNYYLTRIPCPRMKDAQSRFDHVLKLIDEFGINGVIFYTLKFCDPFLFDVPVLKEQLARRLIPVLRLESDYTPGTMGRVRTRVEAFVEILRQNARVV